MSLRTKISDDDNERIFIFLVSVYDKERKKQRKFIVHLIFISFKTESIFLFLRNFRSAEREFNGPTTVWWGERCEFRTRNECSTRAIGYYTTQSNGGESSTTNWALERAFNRLLLLFRNAKYVFVCVFFSSFSLGLPIWKPRRPSQLAVGERKIKANNDVFHTRSYVTTIVGV